MTRSWDEMRGDTFDSREIIDRIADLEATLEDVTGDEAIDAADELAILETIQAEGSASVADWRYGETFIPNADFTEYAQQLAEDIGAVNAEATWPNNYIDWDAAADALRMDYTAFTFDGIDYLARA
jgi:antirestriction protein